MEHISAAQNRDPLIPPVCPRWCSPWHCVAFDDTLIHRSAPITIQADGARTTVGWFRIDVDDVAGSIGLEVLPRPPAEQVAA